MEKRERVYIVYKLYIHTLEVRDGAIERVCVYFAPFAKRSNAIVSLWNFQVGKRRISLYPATLCVLYIIASSIHRHPQRGQWATVDWCLGKNIIHYYIIYTLLMASQSPSYNERGLINGYNANRWHLSIPLCYIHSNWNEIYIYIFFFFQLTGQTSSTAMQIIYFVSNITVWKGHLENKFFWNVCHCTRPLYMLSSSIFRISMR